MSYYQMSFLLLEDSALRELADVVTVTGFEYEGCYSRFTNAGYFALMRMNSGNECMGFLILLA